MVDILSQDWTGWLYPNGEFGLSRARTVRVTSPPPVDPRTIGLPMLGFHPAVTAESAAEYQEFLRDPDTAMGLSKVSKSPKKRAPRGSKGVTAHGKRILRQSAFCLEREFGTRNITFLTATIPEHECLYNGEIVKAWPRIMKRFIKELGRELERKGLPAMISGCYEMQEARRARCGGLPYHCHLIFPGRRSSRGAWALSVQKARDLWRAAVDGEVGPVEWRGASVRVEAVKRSVGAYMAKYLSKGTGGIEPSDCLSSWYTCTVAMRKQIAASTTRLKGESAGLLLGMVRSMPQSLAWVRPILLELHGGVYQVGIAGRLTESASAELAAIARGWQ